MMYLLLLSLVAQQSGLCLRALQAAPAFTECTAAPEGVAIAKSRQEADELLRIAQAARRRFIEHFPSKPGPYVLFFAEGDAPVAPLKAIGFTTVLPWVSPDRLANLIVEGGLKKAADTAKRPLAATAVTATMAKIPAVAAKMRAQQPDVIAHELGHQWFEEIYWRTGKPHSMGYGTRAPDWLDEAAALLMEGLGAAAERRASFHRDWLAATPPSRSHDQAIGDLGYLLNRSNPTMSDGSASRAPGLTVSAVSGKARFYEQVRMFADYLIDRSADPRILDRISRFVASGGSADDWFATQRGYPVLPKSVPALQEDWARWIDDRARSVAGVE